jgi:transcriptional regulator with XRE-family HTH domain
VANRKRSTSTTPRKGRGDPALGLRVRRFRTKLGLSQEALGHLVCRSEGWVYLVERGDAEPGYFDLTHLAGALNVDVEQLLHDGAGRISNASAMVQSQVIPVSDPAMMVLDPSAAGMSPGEWLEEMRRRAFLRAMATVTGATAIGWWPSSDRIADGPAPIIALRDILLDHGTRAVVGTDPPDLAALRGSVHQLWAAFQGARYQAALTAMPDVLRQGQLAVTVLDGDDRLTAAMLLSQTYQAISTFMRKIGDVNLAILAADRAMASAQLHGSPVTLAESARFLCLILGDTGHHHQAVQVCITAAGRFESEVHGPDPAAISIYGQLILAGAEAAARGGEAALARDFFGQAVGTARRLGRDANHGFTAFGPTNIAVHQVHAAVVLGDGEAAVRQGKTIDLTRLPVLERRAHHLLDVGLGYNLIGQPEEAAVSLLTAEQLAAEEIRFDPLARLLAEQLRHRASSLTAQLDALVGRMPPLSS